ncbi:MAG: site-specific integrase, partial [Sulfurovum sp.]|nr:site-specific integrase [Sulfurovum sp.]
GKTVQKSTGLPDTPQNRTLVKREVIPALHRKILLGEVGKEKPKTFEYYSQLYLRDKKHLKSYPQIVNKVALINQTFGSMPITRIKRSDIKNWVNNRLEVNSPKTVKEYLVDIRGVFNIAIDHDHIKENVAKNIDLPTHQKEAIEPFTPQEVNQILAKANDWLRLYLAIGFYTGLRTGEILGLMQSDIDIKSGVIHVRRNITKGKVTTPKTQKSFREVPILDDLKPYLVNLPKSLWLFTKDDGKPFSDFPGNRRDQWRNLLSECGIKYRKIYATRHTFIVSMLKYSNLSILEIAQLAGHTSTQMIIQNYGRFIQGEHLKIDRGLKIFTDKYTDSSA